MAGYLTGDIPSPSVSGKIFDNFAVYWLNLFKQNIQQNPLEQSQQLQGQI